MRWIKAWILGGIVGFAALALSQPALAAEGRDDPAFQSAVSDWLAGDDAAAIPALSRLAASGNAASQILLALIDTTPAYQGDWLITLPRAQRMELLRAPKTKPDAMSGPNWMAVAATSEPLAQAWLQLWDGDATTDVVATFARLGETRSAYFAARQLFSREKRGFGALVESGTLPEGLMPLAIRDWQQSAPDRAAAARAALEAGNPARRVLGDAAPQPEDLLAWARTDSVAAPFLVTLETLCPAPQGDPVNDLAAYLPQAGGFWALAWLGPPAEALIDPQRYAQSPRAAEVARNLLRQGNLTDPAALAASPCIAALVAAR
jgi:hypothetical protein